MENLMLMILMFMISVTFIMMTHPLAAGLIILMQATIISLYSGLMTKTFWFSYSLFLIFIGGLLVLFIYVTAISSNEMFSLSMKPLLMLMMFMFIIMITALILNDPFYYSSINQNLETMPISNLTSLIPESSLILNKIYNFPTNMLTIMLVLYLLLSLIVVVKITNISSGPLRSK